MPGADRTIRADLVGNDISLSSTIENAGRSADRSSHKLAGLGSALKTVGKVAIVGAAVGIGAASKFLVQGTKDAAAYQTLQLKTAAVIKSTGNAAHISVKGIDGLAASLESVSGVDETLIINSQNVLATFTNIKNVGKNRIFDQATKSTLDMSVALGSDLQTASIQVGKALNDPIKGVGALSKVGVSFTEGQKKQIKTLVDSGHTMEAQKLILHELNKEFGGAAAAAGSGFEGSLARAKDAVSDAGRSIGSVLLPQVTKVADWFANKFPPAFQTGSNAVRAAYLAFQDGDVQLGEGFATMQKVGYHIRVLVDDFDLFKQAFRDGPQWEAHSKVEELGKSFRSLYDSIRTGNPQGLKDLSANLVTLGPAIVKIVQSSGKGFGDTFHVAGVAVGFLADHTGLLAKLMPVIVGGIVAYKVAQLAANVAALATVPLKVSEIVVNRKLAQSNRALLVSRGELTATTITGTAVEEISTVAKSEGALATIRAAIASKVAAAAAKVMAAGQWLLNAALAANPIGLVIVAVALLATGFVLLWRHSQTFRTVVTAAFQAVAGMILGSISAILGAYGQFFAVLGHLPGKAGAAFRSASNAAKGAKREVDRLNASIQAIPKNKTLNFTVRYKGPAVIDGVRIAGGAGSSRGGVAWNAKGGPAYKNVPMVVGDGGRPELFVPDGNGTILPKVPEPGGGRPWTGGGDQGVTINVYVQGSVLANAGQIRDAVVQAFVRAPAGAKKLPRTAMA